MSDLVEKLRARNERFQAGHGNYLYYGGGDAILDTEAAAALEALTRERDEARVEAEEMGVIGERDGYSDAVQAIDMQTGGDGEYRFVLGGDPDDRHCPDPASMIARIVARFEAAEARATTAEAERDAARAEVERLKAEDLAINELADSVWQALDDMGKDGTSVCLATKALLRVAYEPFNMPGNDPVAGPDMALQAAQAVLIGCGLMLATKEAP